MVTTQINTLIINTVVALTLDKISNLALKGAGSVIYNKSVTDITEINDTKRSYTFYLNETEGNGDITSIELQDTTGLTYCTQPFVLTKNNFQSLTIVWTVEII